jgi:hypothetical protein
LEHLLQHICLTLPFVKSATSLFFSTHLLFFLPVTETDCSNIKIYLLRLNKCQLYVCIYFNHVYWRKSFLPGDLQVSNSLCGARMGFYFLFSGPHCHTKNEHLTYW